MAKGYRARGGTIGCHNTQYVHMLVVTRTPYPPRANAQLAMPSFAAGDDPPLKEC